MGDEGDGLSTGLPKLEQALVQVLARLLVECGKGLVHQKDVGVHGQQAGYSHALLHSAGKRVWVGFCYMAKTHGFQRVSYPLGDMHPVGAFMQLALGVLHRKGHVLFDVEPGHQAELLENHPAFGTGCGDGAALEADLSQGGGKKARHHGQAHGLAAAGRAHDAHEFALFDGKAHLAQGEPGLLSLPVGEEGLGNIVEFDEAHRLPPSIRLRISCSMPPRSTRSNSSPTRQMTAMQANAPT